MRTSVMGVTYIVCTSSQSTFGVSSFVGGTFEPTGNRVQSNLSKIMLVIGGRALAYARVMV